jgi:PEGA domain
MKARHLLLLCAGSLLAAAPLLAGDDHAVPRGGGGGSAQVGAQHVSPAPSAASPSGSGPSVAAPSHVPTIAERRHPRAGTGTGGGGGYGGYWGGPSLGGGWYPYGYGGGGYYPYWGYWWPYGAYGWYGGWGYPWGAGAVYSYVQPDRGSIRLLVDPPQARVYVDGYYAGTVDDFDGLFQRLHVSPGRHEIEIKLSGYKTYRARVYVGSGATLKLDHELEPGNGEVYDDLAGEGPAREASRVPPAIEVEPAQRSPRPETRVDAGELRLQVAPPDASVYVDGSFRGTGRQLAVLPLSAGAHRVEVVRPGYRTEEREFEVAPGEPTDLAIDLQRP